MTKVTNSIDTSKMIFDPLCKKSIIEQCPELKPFKNLENLFVDKMFRYVCFLYDPESPLFKMLIGERKNQALTILNIKEYPEEILANQLGELRWAANLFFTVTNNPVIEIYVSLDEAFSNLLEKARTKPIDVDEAQEKIAYEGIAKAADNAFEMYGKLKAIRDEFSKQFGEFDILDVVKKGEKAKQLETVINFAEMRAEKKAKESKDNKK